MSLPIYRSPAGSPYRLGLVKSTQQGKWPTGPRRSRTLPGQTRVGGLLGRDQNNTSHHATALNRGLSTNFGWVGDGHIKLSWHRSSQDDRRSHPRGEVLCLSSGTSLGTGSSSDKPHGTAQPQQQQTPQPQPQQQQQQAQPQQQQPWWRFGGRGPSIVPPGSGAFLIPIVLFAMGVFVLASAAYSNFVFGAPFKASLAKATSKLMMSSVFRQIWSIVLILTLMRVGLEPTARTIRKLIAGQSAMTDWEKSPTFVVLREIYRPLELLLYVGAASAVAESVLPTLISVPRAAINHIMRTIVTLCVIISAAVVVFKLKDKALREGAWRLELSGEKTQQRRLEAVDKLVTIATITVGTTLSLQAIGFDVNSLLAIGGIGGIALSLAGREILENLFNGLVILSTSPFETGDEVWFKPAPTTQVDGIVVDIGWFRTSIRSFEREVWVVPNSVFSKVVVLNVSRKNQEWRYLQRLQLTLDSEPHIPVILAEMRQIVRKDPRIIQKLHRRVFLHAVNDNSLEVLISFYIDAPTEDAARAHRENFTLTFLDILRRNGGRLHRSSMEVTLQNGPRFGQDTSVDVAGAASVLSDWGIERVPLTVDEDERLVGDLQRQRAARAAVQEAAMRAAAEKQAQGDLRRRRIAELQEAARAGNAATMVEVVPIEVGSEIDSTDVTDDVEQLRPHGTSGVSGREATVGHAVQERSVNGSLKDASVAQGVDKLDTLASNETTRDEEDGVAEKPRKSVFRDVGPLET